MLYALCFIAAAVYGIILELLYSNMSVPYELNFIEHKEIKRIIWNREEITSDDTRIIKNIDEDIVTVIQEYERHDISYNELCELDRLIPKLFVFAMVTFSIAIPTYLKLPFWCEFVVIIITLISFFVFLILFYKRKHLMQYNKEWQICRSTIDKDHLTAEELRDYLDDLIGTEIFCIKEQTNEYKRKYAEVKAFRLIALIVFTIAVVLSKGAIL